MPALHFHSADNICHHYENVKRKYASCIEIAILFGRKTAHLVMNSRECRLRDMCYVSLHTGIRPCELYSIRGGDLVPQAGFFWVDGKGGKREKIAASKEIMELLGCYKRKPHEYIFQSKILS
jgi:integrase